MTGYGSAKLETESFIIKAEFKSLNGKFLELKCRMPRHFYSKEIELRNLFGPKLIRGSVSLNINVESKGVKNLSKVEINMPLAMEYKEKLSLLSKELGQENNDLFREILRMPEVVSTIEKESTDEDWSKLVETCTIAYESFDAFRVKEGEGLSKHFNECIDSIDSNFTVVRSFLEERRASLEEKVYSRIMENVEESLVDKNRLEQELILYLEKYDITEEIKRLEGHLVHFKDSMDTNESHGKKLGFISQEIGREINTMGVKANYLPMQKAIVNMKESLEMIKEQVLNTL